MRQYLTLFLCSMAFLFGASPASAQDYINKRTVTGGAKKSFTKGMEAYMQSKNREAVSHFEKAVKSSPKFIDAHIQLGAAHYDLKNYAAAEEVFERAAALSPDYKTMVIYTLGKIEFITQKFDEAEVHFKQYLSLEKKNEKLRAKAEKYLLDCRFLAQAIENKVPFEPSKLSATVNTDDFAEYLPALTADGETLVFTRKVRGQEDFFISRKVDGDWRTAQPLEEINTPANEGAQSISADGKYLVFTACGRPDGIGSCDLYFSEVVNGRWTKAKNLGAPVNTKAWESQPSISADGRIIYFASNRGGGYGDQDIWITTRSDDGSWSAPVNAGSFINSKLSDQSPFIHPDGRTLYFMSDGWPGFGAHDLFYTRLGADGIWDTPVNLGFPINTSASEGALVISLDGSTAYFASDRHVVDQQMSFFDNPMRGGDTDIYSFQLYEAARPHPVTYVKARVFDAKKKFPLEAKVEFVDLTTGKVHSESFTDIDGEFLICLPLGANYSLNVNKEKYIFHSENFQLTDQNAGKPYVLEIGLHKIPPSVVSQTTTAPPPPEPIILRNVFFDTGSANLRPESYVELEKLKLMLVENPTMSIQINGHTDDVGSDQNNLLLSKDRAKAVYTFLSENGIKAARLAFEGYGESKPIQSNDDDEGRQQNRRTEFIITGS